MSDNYQAVYDAVRSKFSGVDVNGTIESAIRNMGISFYFEQAGEAMKQAAYEYERPSVLFKPTLSREGNMWCALLGENLQSGVAGFGETPSKAMYDFDQKFLTEKAA